MAVPSTVPAPCVVVVKVGTMCFRVPNASGALFTVVDSLRREKGNGSWRVIDVEDEVRGRSLLEPCVDGLVVHCEQCCDQPHTSWSAEVKVRSSKGAQLLHVQIDESTTQNQLVGRTMRRAGLRDVQPTSIQLIAPAGSVAGLFDKAVITFEGYEEPSNTLVRPTSESASTREEWSELRWNEIMTLYRETRALKRDMAQLNALLPTEAWIRFMRGPPALQDNEGIFTVQEAPQRVRRYSTALILLGAVLIAAVFFVLGRASA